jgi:anti-sigma-K factor RskA
MNAHEPEPRQRLGVVLGAVDDREADAFEELAARSLALLVEPVDPPASLRAALLAGILPAGEADLVERPSRLASTLAAVRGALTGTPAPRPAWVGATSVLTEVRSVADAGRASTAFADGAATVTVESSPSLRTAVAVFEGAPDLPTGQVYQLWTLRNGKPRSAGTFAPSRTGRLVVRLSGGFRSGDQVAVTVEPRGGSFQPTTTPLFALAA